MRQRKEKVYYFFFYTIIMFVSFIFMAGIGDAAVTTYRWTANTGTTIASGVTTNYGCSDPTGYRIALLTTGSSAGCSSVRYPVATIDPLVDMYSNTAYAVNTNVVGGDLTVSLRDGPNTFTFKLIYIFPNGTKVVLPGTAIKAISSGTDAEFVVSLAGINGTVPAGAKLGLMVSQSGSSARMYLGDNPRGFGPSGVFTVSETSSSAPINITSHGNNITNNNSLSLLVYPNTNIRFNLTTNITIDSYSKTNSSGTIASGNDTLGKSTFWADFNFTTSGTQNVNLTVINSSCACSDYRNWVVVVTGPVTTQYNFQNNATTTNLGYGGSTIRRSSGTTITELPYKQTYQTLSGSQENIRYVTSSNTTEYEVFRFYSLTNTSEDTRIGANIPGQVRARGMSTDSIMNVSVWDYDPATGVRLFYGNAHNTTTGGYNSVNYPFTLNNPSFILPSGHRIMISVNYTTPTIVSGNNIRLYFNDGSSYITLTESTILISGHGNNVTNNDSLSISINQNNSVRFNLTTSSIISSNLTTIPSNVISMGNDSLGKTTFWADFLFPYFGTQYVTLEVQNISGIYGIRNWTVTVNDVTPPDQVTGLTNLSTPTTNSIQLTWNETSDNAGGSGIKEYFVQRKNDSINWLTVLRPTINATNLQSGYDSDAYRYTARNPVPVNCGNNCHPNASHSPVIPALSAPIPTLGNYWMKYDATYLYIAAMIPDNDTAPDDDAIELLFDTSKDSSATPQSDDKRYELHEGNYSETKVGNGTGWIDFISNATYAVERDNDTQYNISGNMYEIRIPLPELGNPINGSSVRFAIEFECKDGGDNTTRNYYYPDLALAENPSTWNTLLTYRNNTQWDAIGNTSLENYAATGLVHNFRYYLSVFARDNALNDGTPSTSKTFITADRPGYNVTGFVTSGAIALAQATVSIGEYTLISGADGAYEIHDLVNGTYQFGVNAFEMVANSTNVTISGSDRIVNFSLVDNVVPSVISNTNNLYIINNTFINLSSTITDAGSGVKNATVNVSSINFSLNEVILSLQGGFWINSSIIADRETTGFENLTITAYDFYGNSNNSTNMTAWISLPPNIIFWENNKTNNNSQNFDLIQGDTVNFTITAQSADSYLWTYDDNENMTGNSYFTNTFSELGVHYVNVSIINNFGSEEKNWVVTVSPITIDVTLSNVPVDFGDLISGSSNHTTLLPLNVTIQGTTNVNVNITLSGSNFISITNNFDIEYLEYSNSSTGIKTAMKLDFPFPPYENWMNISKLVSTDRSIYLWLGIPPGQAPGSYTSDISVRVEEYS